MAKTPSNASTANGHDAIALLTADHKAVKALFVAYARLAEDDDDRKEALVQRICDELTMHAQIEEELFYPAVRRAIDDDALLDEARVEHTTVKEFIAQLMEMLPDDDLYSAKVKVLAEYVEHHVKEEEDEMFPEVRKADLDTAALGQAMAARKEELKQLLGMLEEE